MSGKKYTPEQQIVSFWNRVNKEGSIPTHMPHLGQCWEWTGTHHRQGYGYTWTRDKYILSHRYVWIITNGEIPDDLKVLHKCDNPCCVRPSHLFLGTQLDNMKDRKQKNRHAQLIGELNPNCKVTDVQVGEIRRRYAMGNVLYKDIAKDMGISISTVGKIVTGKHIKRKIT